MPRGQGRRGKGEPAGAGGGQSEPAARVTGHKALSWGLTGAPQGLCLWPVISWPSPLGPGGYAGNSPEFPNFLIYKMGTVMCTLYG